jgi:hypothetical protein
MKTREFKDLFDSKEVNKVIIDTVQVYKLARHTRYVQEGYTTIDAKARQILPNFKSFDTISATLTRFVVEFEDGTCFIEFKNKNQPVLITEYDISLFKPEVLVSKVCHARVNGESRLTLTDAPSDLSKIIKVRG